MARYCAEYNIELVVIYMGVLIAEADASRRNRATILPYLERRNSLLFVLYDVMNGKNKRILCFDPWVDNL